MSDTETEPTTEPTAADPTTAAPVSDDYDRIFGDGGATTAPDTVESISFDPTEAGPGRMPKGDYIARVTEPPTQEKSSNGNFMMKVAFEVIEGEYTGAMMWRRYMLKGRAGAWTREFLEALGLDAEAAGEKPINPRDIDGKKCVISVRPQKNNDDFDEVYKVKLYTES